MAQTPPPPFSLSPAPGAGAPGPQAVPSVLPLAAGHASLGLQEQGSQTQDSQTQGSQQRADQAQPDAPADDPAYDPTADPADDPAKVAHPVLKVVTYNIHKGVNGLGPVRRLEIHRLAHAVAQLDADVLALQEVRAFHHREARRFAHWPAQPQADFLAPPGYHVAYRSNAITRHGEHGNALLSRWPIVAHRHQDMSDHRFEQRGLLHVELCWQGLALHVLVVHLGLVRASRARQVAQLLDFVVRELPADAPVVLAGDFNDWGQRSTQALGRAGLHSLQPGHHPTFPARWPLVQLDHIYVRGLVAHSVRVPRGPAWAGLSDHLPLVMTLGLA